MFTKFVAAVAVVVADMVVVVDLLEVVELDVTEDDADAAATDPGELRRNHMYS